MHRIDSPGHVDGMFVEADLTLGRRGTNLSADWLNDTQENQLAVLEEAGIVPTKGRAADLVDAIKAIVGGVTGSGGGSVPTTRTLTAAGLVKGGGDLSQNRSFAVDAATPEEITIGVANDKAITPLALRAAGEAGLTPDGFARLPGGLILQWGSRRGSYTEGNIYVPFALEFPNACLAAVPTAVNATGGDRRDLWTQLIGRGVDGFTVKFQMSSDTDQKTIDGLDFIAVGF